jgi:hypothetical protein
MINVVHVYDIGLALHINVNVILKFIYTLCKCKIV